ncbi:MAG: hypothetical protein AB4911_12385 [Oscillochloridaceae bacterium umkhey_bin13]
MLNHRRRIWLLRWQSAFLLVGFTAYLMDTLSPFWYAIFGLPLILIPLSLGLAVLSLQPGPIKQLAKRVPYALAALALGGLLIWAQSWHVLGIGIR